MADPICRWRNASIKQLMEFNSLLPLYATSKKEGREHVETLWRLLGGEDFFTTPYQLAAQMGTYYEDSEYLYPRFCKYLSIEEAANYMHTWGENYYSPNPYAKSIKNVRPVVINKFLVNYAQAVLNPTLTDALREMFGNNVIGNTDILKNMLNAFSEVNINGEDTVTVKPVAQGKHYKDDEIYPSVDADDKKSFFEQFGKVRSYKTFNTMDSLPLQQIFYGAPGTGKSYSVDDVCKKYRHFRTTFHPDSDYSTFVGCYKPTKDAPTPIYGFDSVGHTVEAKDANGNIVKKQEITYKFVPQTFTNAYVEAWRDLTKPVFLVIEEINRGNCAQIFGDLFQLLDRQEQGYSSYEIEANTDLRNYIAEQDLYIEDVVDGNDEDISDKLMSGELMVLPPNLYIWATMNTSDQSLFPIDSAFKRRWDWKYVPINTEAKSGWKIEVNGVNYSWSSFLDKINAEIEDTTSSEDKQLGFFFCKADDTDEDGNDGVITAEKFVSKVLFYLYNDVFKDYGFEREFFKDNSKLITFRSFYNMDGSINEERVEKLLDNLGVEKTDSVNNEDNQDVDSDSIDAGKKEHKETLVAVTIDGERLTADGSTQFDLYINAIKKLGVNRIAPVIESMKYRRKGSPLATKTKVQGLVDSDGYSYVEVEGYYFVKGVNGYTLTRILEDLNKSLSLNIKIEYK